jgi:glutaredoxin-like protein NrdH
MTVTVFTTGPGCHMCLTTKIHLKKRGIAFEEVRLDENPELADKVRELGFTTAPVVLIDEDDVWDGYRSDAIDELAANLCSSSNEAA